MSFKDLVLLTIGCVLSSNYVLVNFFNADSIISNSRNTLRSNIFCSLYLGLVLIVSSILIWPLENWLISQVGYLRIVVYVIAILLVIAIVALLSKKKVADLIPLSLSSGVLGSVMLFQSNGYSFLETVFASVGGACGYLLVTVALSGVREKVKDKYVPSAFRGYPIMLIALSIIALTVYCF